MRGARALALVWAALRAGAAAGAGALAWLGPPAPHRVASVADPARPRTAPEATIRPAAAVTSPPAPPVAPPSTTAAAAPATAPGPAGTTRTDPTIPGPDPALLAPAADNKDQLLPRIGPDGRAPMQVYAAPSNPADPHPKVAILLAGLGLSDAESRNAIDTLPPQVSLAFSPYAPAPAALLAAARAKGHEILVSIPMEPQGYPLNDPGPHALLSWASPEQNRANLDWDLARIPGAVGATGALDDLRGERFGASGLPFQQVEQTLARRGLLYIDPRPASGIPTDDAGRGVDIVLDDPPWKLAIDSHLADLERFAQDHGTALGLAGPVRPMTVSKIAAWAAGLSARGITLVPVSALARPAAGPLRAAEAR